MQVHKDLSGTQVLFVLSLLLASVSHLCSVEMVFRNEFFMTFLWNTMEDIRISFSSTVYLTVLPSNVFEVQRHFPYGNIISQKLL